MGHQLKWVTINRGTQKRCQNAERLAGGAQGYELYGFTRDGDATVYREWAPAAQSAQLIGDFNGWEGTPLKRDEFGVWSVRLSDGGCEKC